MSVDPTFQTVHEIFEPQVAVVDFHHGRGPEVEFWVTPKGQALYDRNDWSLLSFLALADGSHAVTEEFSYFTLLNRAENSDLSSVEESNTEKATATTEGHQTTDKTGSTLFGISCTRQIRSELVKNKSPDVTRSTVQKAVVVILKDPATLGGIRDRLSAVTAAWFGQEDFTNTDILNDFQEILRSDATTRSTEIDYPPSLPIREVIHEFRYQTLVLVKALLLQKKILFFGTRCERLCLLQFALISLIPNLMSNLQDCADPALDTYATNVTKATSLRTSDRKSLQAYMGLPLQIFGESSFFSPYTPLQLLDTLMDSATHSFIVGSTNNLLLAHKDRYCDVLVNLDEESNKVQIINPDLKAALGLSAADRRWIDHVTQTVLETWDPSNPSRPSTLGYAGSEDAIHLQFEEYILSLLSSAAYKVYHDAQPFFDNAHSNVETKYTDPSETSIDFNNEFLSHWRRTPNYQLFERLTKDAGIFDIIEPKHPTAGAFSIEDVQRRLAQGVSELHLDERVREGRETVGRVIEGGRERVGAGVARFWKEVDDFRQRREVSRSREQDDQLRSLPRINTDLSEDTTNPHGKNGGDLTSSGPNNQDRIPSTATVGGTWAAAFRDRASKVQIQRPNIDTGNLSAAAKDNAAKAGQYLSSWGTWARDRGREWSDSRKLSAGPDSVPDSLKGDHIGDKEVKSAR